MNTLICLGVVIMLWSGIVLYQLHDYIEFSREDYMYDMALTFLTGMGIFLYGFTIFN